MAQRAVTLTADGVSIRLTHPLTVAFFTQNDGEEIGVMAVKNMDCWAECMHRCMAASSNKDTSNDDFESIVSAMHAMEKRLNQAMHERSEAVMAKSQEVGDGVQTALMRQVETAVQESVARVDVQAIGAAMGASVREWLSAASCAGRDTEARLQQAVKELEGRLHDIVAHMVAQPQHMRHEHLMTTLGGLPAQVSQMCAKAAADTYTGASLSDKIAEMRVRLEEAMALHSREHLDNRSSVALMTLNVQQMIAGMVEHKSAAGLQHSAVAHVPVLIKSVFAETFKGFESQSQEVRSAVHGICEKLSAMERDVSGALQVLQRSSVDVTGRVDHLAQQVTTAHVRQANSNSGKGIRGESQLHDMLCERLSARDNYSVERVGGVSNACDLTVKRLAFPDVRVEVKAHGELTRAKVGAKETAKFQRDLATMGSHGIFVSLHSGIVGKGKIEVDVMPNNKLAVYLSANEFDIDTIHDMLHVIYRVDGIMAAAVAHDSEYVRVTQEDMARVQRHLRDFAVKTQTVRSHLKESISLLDEMLFDKIECVLSGRVKAGESSLKGAPPSCGVAAIGPVIAPAIAPVIAPVSAGPSRSCGVAVPSPPAARPATPAAWVAADMEERTPSPCGAIGSRGPDDAMTRDQIKAVLKASHVSCHGGRETLLVKLAALRVMQTPKAVVR